ncbi:MAG: helix-turn-helix transcriptional regulator [Bradyrhizobium sp.]|nr:helix-turn-helix transcriptional regulator [Bradyrhizobium sp.]
MTKFKTSRQIASDLRAMISYDVNQGDIAKELRVSRAYLSEFLSGKREVSSAILEALGYDIEPLYRLKPTRNRPAAPSAEGVGNGTAMSNPGTSHVKAPCRKRVQERSAAFAFRARRVHAARDR